jgi:hypothetical protein
MKRTVIGLGLALSATAALTGGCATEGDDSECQPGDIDCAEDGGGGKADAWDADNDPAALSSHLQYRLSELPKRGALDKPAWKDRFPNAPASMQVMWTETYFPTAQGSSNNRWLGASVQSPLEKYDRAFNNAAGAATQPRNCGPTAKADFDAYKAAAGPAAKWHVDNFQYMGNGHNGRDDDSNSQVDECSGGQDGWGPDRTAAGWWGLCHAWTPAAMLEPEAIHPVTVNGVTFERSDIHALVMTVYDRNDAIMIGGRCNSREFKPDNTTSANDDCLDSNAGMLHVVLTNALGLNDTPIAMDRTAGDEVWNQPIYSYEVTKQAEISKTKANECVGGPAGSTWTYNTKAKKLYEVRMNVTYLVEGNASAQVLDMNDYLTTDDYHYILELDGNGKVIGGRYCTESTTDHPDFLWAPLRASSSTYGRNPNVSLDKVRSLLNQSVAGGGGGTGGGQTFSSTESESIPDDDTTGITSDIAVTGVNGTGGAQVTVDVTHTYIGDLTITLFKDGRQIKVLHAAAGGSADNLHQTYAVSASELTGDRNGTYTLTIVDGAAEDTGTLDGWKVAF